MEQLTELLQNRAAEELTNNSFRLISILEQINNKGRCIVLIFITKIVDFKNFARF